MSSESKVAVEVRDKVQEKKKVIILRSNDGKEFEVDVAVATKESELIKELIEADCATPFVPLPNVTGAVVAKVVEYWNLRHSAVDDEQRRWESDRFLKGMGRNEMSEIVVAADYLIAHALLDLMNMTVEDVRDYFSIENEYFTPEEEAKLGKESKWAFD